ncbi:hypothetical protein V6N12_024062 [Hibiscus sabdariffa]|uniref:Endonuclease/exonuclease/phosphatase domain-containing protein n=1 Tax=Hibiscus sabdariffa TaxID=183260 RepID=A0ABR2FZG4_9ROSI
MEEWISEDGICFVEKSGSQKTRNRAEMGIGAIQSSDSLTFQLYLTMALLSWNVRGLGNKDTTRALNNVVFKFRPSIVFLSETKGEKKYLEKIRMKMKFSNVFYFDPLGIIGGLALWWTEDPKITIFLRAYTSREKKTLSSNLNGSVKMNVSKMSKRIGNLLILAANPKFLERS